MKEIVIVHYLPIRFYPPAINMLDYLDKLEANKMYVYTTGESLQTSYENTHISYGRASKKRIINMMMFFFFTFRVFFKLVFSNAKTIFYYESSSALPVYLYLRFFPKRNVNVFIHYHEYYTRAEYENQSLITKKSRKLEPFILKKAVWVSHTNKFRLGFFHNEYDFIPANVLKIIPNYPPKSWQVFNLPKSSYVNEEVIKLVSIGAVSFSKMYFKEMIDWVIAQQGKVSLDIFAFSVPTSVANYIQEQNCVFINIRGPVKYDDIPQILKNYHVGLILYKPETHNVKYSASNKLFEYLTNGLDVWFPKEILGSHEYVTQGTYPKVVMVDFSEINKLRLSDLVIEQNLTYKKFIFTYEDVFAPLLKKLA